MSITPRNTPTDPWKAGSMLFFGTATAVCLYVGNCYNNYRLLLGLCLFGLCCSIVYLFIPSEDNERCTVRGTSIKDSRGMVEDERAPFLQRIVGISIMVITVLFVLYIFMGIITSISSDSENSEDILTVIQHFISTLMP